MKVKNYHLIMIVILVVLCAHSYFIFFNKGILMTLEDFYKQQLVFYRDGWEKVHSGQFTFWTWNNLLGNDYLAANSFYFTYSPFFWLAMLSPKIYLPQTMLILNMVKMILAAVFMMQYLKHIKVTQPMILLLGGIMYAFSGALILNYFFNHFNDTFCLFPLFLIASEKFIKHNHYLAIIAIFALQTMININFLYNLLIFISLYILFRYLMHHHTIVWKHFFKQFIVYLLSLNLAIAIGMVNFLPTVLNLLHNPRVGTFQFSFQKMNFDYITTTLLATINETLFPPTSIYRDELVSEKMIGSFNFQSLTLFVSTIAMVILPLMFKLLTKRQCFLIICYFTISLFIYIVPVLNSMATGFSNVTFRWGFIICGLTIALSCYLWQQFQVQHLILLLKSVISYSLFAIGIVLFTVKLQAYREVSYYIGRLIYGILPTFVVVFLLCIAIIFMLVLKRVKLTWLVPIVIIQSISSFMFFVNFNSGYDKKGYYDAEVIKHLNVAQKTIDDWHDTKIIDKVNTRILMDDWALLQSTVKINGGLAFGINMPRVFHSVYNSQTNLFYDYSQGFVNETNTYWSRGFNNDSLIHSLIATKGMISTTDHLAQQHLPVAFMKQTQRAQYVYYNNALYIGIAQKFKEYLTVDEFNQLPYMIKPQVLNKYVIVDAQPTITHGSMPMIDYSDKTLQYLKDYSTISLEDNENFRVNQITVMQLRMTEEGTLYIPHNDNVKIFKNNQFYEDVDFNYYDVHETMTPISYQKGDIIDIQLLPGQYHISTNLYQANDFALVNVSLSDMQTMVQQRMINHLNEKLLPNQYLATFKLEEASLIYFAIPANEGWSAQVDHQIQQIKEVQGGFISLMLPAGQHQIVLTYTTPGFYIGLIVSTVASIIFIILLVINRRRCIMS